MAASATDVRVEPHGDMVIVDALAAGSREALSAVYRLHGQRVFRVAYQHAASREMAEEVVQETFLLLMREPGKFDPARGELGAFLCGVARQLVRRSQYAAGRNLCVEFEEAAPPDEGAASSVLSEIIRHQQWRQLHDAVASLPEPYREVIVMHHLEEFSYEEVAEALECPIGTVRSRLSRAREMLGRKLAASRADMQVTPEPGKGGTRDGESK
ncbi:MAG: RNA polymerase sigma factor [Bryobacterales bacterium]|nr:RNA polymerase sigma factor [Bryobacterales bacterium]